MKGFMVGRTGRLDSELLGVTEDDLLAAMEKSMRTGMKAWQTAMSTGRGA